MSELPDRPDLDQLRRQARELLRAATDGEPRALERIRSVSDRTTLSSAQLALAREYGFPSWPALRIGAEHRRHMSELAEESPLRYGYRSGNAAAERWSFGGASAITTAAGVLDLSVLLSGAGHAVLDASLMPSPEAQRRLAGPPKGEVPGLRFVAGLLGQTRAHSEMPRFDDVLVADDRGTTYNLAFESGVVPGAEPGEIRGPIQLRLCLEPVPPRDCRWLELRGHGGSITRLLPSARPALRVGTPRPASGSAVERELTELGVSLIGHQLAALDEDPQAEDIFSQHCTAALARIAKIRHSGELDSDSELPDQVALLCAVLSGRESAAGLPRAWSGILDAAHRTDGPGYHMDIPADLRAVDSTAIQLDSLVSEPGSWQVHLRARPGWWTRSSDYQRQRAAISVRAEDNLGVKYMSVFGGSGINPSGDEEVALQFRPRLDPLARAMKLTFTGASEQIAVSLDLDSASKSETG